MIENMKVRRFKEEDAQEVRNLIVRNFLEVKKQMVLCTIFMQPFGLKIAWKSAVCHEKTVYEKNLPFLIQYRFIS